MKFVVENSGDVFGCFVPIANCLTFPNTKTHSLFGRSIISSSQSSFSKNSERQGQHGRKLATSYKAYLVPGCLFFIDLHRDHEEEQF